MNIAESSVIKRNTSLLTTAMDNELVMMSMDKGEYYGLNSIATTIWLFLEQPLSLTELINRLVEEYEVDRETCMKDVIPFLEELSQRNVIEIEDVA